MSKTIFLTAVAAVTLIVGLGAPASAQFLSKENTEKLAAASAAYNAELAREAPYVNGSDGSKYKITVTNNTTRNVWMTFYKSQWQSAGQAGQACVPPTQTVTFAKQVWGTSGGGDLRAELKDGRKCGGATLQDKVLVKATNAPIYSGGTAKLVITNVNGNQGDFKGTFTQ